MLIHVPSRRMGPEQLLSWEELLQLAMDFCKSISDESKSVRAWVKEKIKVEGNQSVNMLNEENLGQGIRGWK